MLLTVPDHALVMTVIQSGSMWSEGELVTVDVIAVKMSGFTNDQIITCTNQHRVHLSEIEGVIYPDDVQVAGLTLHVHVQIPSIKLSHAGIYYCDALLMTPPHLDNISHSENFTIKVKGMACLVYCMYEGIDIRYYYTFIHYTVLTPSVQILTESSENLFKAGSIASFGCSALLSSKDDDVSLDCVFTWLMDGTKLTTNSDRYSISQVIISNELSNDTECYSELQIAPMLKLDESLLSCSVHMVADYNNDYIITSDEAESPSLTILVEGILESLPIGLNFIGLTVPCSQLIVSYLSVYDHVSRCA